MNNNLLVHVIDSDVRSRRLVQSAVESFASRLIQSTSLSEANLELGASTPDLIIMDCEFADGSGVEWLAAKRASGLKSPVFVVTAGCHSTEEFCRLKNDLGVSVFLHKPVSTTTLGIFLEQHFKSLPAKASEPTERGMADIEREIRELSLEYLRELPERFAVLRRQAQDLKNGRGEASTAKNEAHKIKGTAASYGAFAIGEQAVIIDDCFKKVLAATGAEASALWEKMEKALDEALRLSEEAVAEAGSESQVPAVYNERDAISAMGLPTARGQSIVIVDDDPDFTRRVSLVLGYEDMLVFSFNDARRIGEILEIVQPDLLILDLNMPDMDGFEVCKRIRLDHRWRQLPVVFLTAQTGWEARVAAFDAGGDDYIPKPVVNQELIARIRVRAEKAKLQEQLASNTTINKLLWQAMYFVMLGKGSGK